ncbi:MAG: hypothetical protein H0U96_02340 [Acidobacteria bacterium]|jgi:predicted anti-sigma-YlaC factor YlaD|nr:hypothetical protein [Acidobacteriota bacterium]
MKNRHIKKIIDQSGFANLSDKDLAVINAHITDCQACRQAFQAARISSVLLRAQSVDNATVPSPFFQAKVLNALREKQNSIKEVGAFLRWWQASAMMIGLMLMLVAVLAALTVVAPFSSAGETQAGMSNFNLYSTDAVIFNQRLAPDLTTEQVFQVLDDTKSDSR